MSVDVAAALPTVDEYCALRIATGLSAMDPVAAVDALPRSRYAVTLREGGRLVGMGVTTTFFLYVFINIAMVMGLIPVVGIPLPLISYGGTAMMTLLLGFGLLMSVHINRDEAIGRRGAADDF